MSTRPGSGVATLRAELVASRAVGAYQQLTLVAPEVAELARPGQFVALTVGGPTSAALLRRCFSIHRVTPGGAFGGTVEIVVANAGPGSEWLTQVPVQGQVELIGPLGKPFPLPTEPVGCVLVGGGYGSAPLFWLAERLRGRGCRVEIVLGAATRDRLFGVDLLGVDLLGVVEGDRVAHGITVTTDDGSAGLRGWVSDVLPEVMARTDASVVYACGPMAMLRSVSDLAGAHGAVAQVAVEEAMACGIGVCMTCVMPVRSGDGTTRMVRSCVEGPTFRGDRVRWDAFVDGHAVVPDDAVGAPAAAAGGGH